MMQYGQSGSRLFTLRVWSEEIAPDQNEWRGKLHDVASGESTYFRDLDGLASCLTKLIVGTSPPNEGRRRRTSKANRPQRPGANDHESDNGQYS